MITYEQAILVTRTAPMISLFITAWFLPLLIFTIIAVASTKRTSGGSYTIRPMLSSHALLWAWIVWGTIGVLLVLLEIFPVFLRMGFISYLFP